MIYRKAVVLVHILFCFFCISCEGQEVNAKVCKENFTKALDNYNSYMLLNQNTSILEKALDDLEISLLCDETRKMSIELKISILLILKNFQDGEKFVNSLEEGDFKRLYKKDMYLYYFKSYLCNEEMCRLDNLKKSESSITKYIESEINFEEEAFYDLFFIISEMTSEEEFSQQILIYRTQYPNHKDFFDILVSTFREDE